MEIEGYQGKRFLRSRMLDELEFMDHLFSTRDFGNQGLHVGDDPAKVQGNRKHLAQVLGADWTTLVSGQQVHGTTIRRVGDGERGRGAQVYDDGLPDCDGLLTDTPGLPLFTFYADCTPIFLADPVRKAVGVIHAGWMGSLADIAGIAVERMAEEFGSRPEDIQAVIAPRIGVECYQVSREVLEGAEALGLGGEPFVQGDRLNLAAVNEELLRRRGVGRIEVDEHCTACNLELFFSHRMEEGRTGRMAAMIMIREEGVEAR